MTEVTIPGAVVLVVGLGVAVWMWFLLDCVNHIARNTARIATALERRK